MAPKESSDWSPADFFLLRHLKSKEYIDRKNLSQLQQKFTDEENAIPLAASRYRSFNKCDKGNRAH